MTNRQTQAVAEAIIYYIMVSGVNEKIEHMRIGQETKDEIYSSILRCAKRDAYDFLDGAEAAITASDAKHVPTLVSALKSIASSTCCETCQEAALVAKHALEALPEDLRNE